MILQSPKLEKFLCSFVSVNNSSLDYIVDIFNEKKQSLKLKDESKIPPVILARKWFRIRTDLSNILNLINKVDAFLPCLKSI